MDTMDIKRYRVPDISCDHCVATITDHLSRVPGTDDVRVDLPTKTVLVRGTASDDVVRSALVDAGYPAAS